MLDREELAASRPRRLHPLLVVVECFGGERLYYSEWTGHVCTEPTFDADTVRGGVLCDEMGLGKTVELLHLILSRQRAVESLDPVPTSSDSVAARQSNASVTSVTSPQLRLLPHLHPSSSVTGRPASPLAPSPSHTSKKARTSPTTLTHGTAAAPHCLCQGALVEVWCEVSGICAIGSGALGFGGAAGNRPSRAAAKGKPPAPPRTCFSAFVLACLVVWHRLPAYTAAE
jgi:hypothetical protein